MRTAPAGSASSALPSSSRVAMSMREAAAPGASVHVAPSASGSSGAIRALRACQVVPA